MAHDREGVGVRGAGRGRRGDLLVGDSDPGGGSARPRHRRVPDGAGGSADGRPRPRPATARPAAALAADARPARALGRVPGGTFRVLDRLAGAHVRGDVCGARRRAAPLRGAHRSVRPRRTIGPPHLDRVVHRDDGRGDHGRRGLRRWLRDAPRRRVRDARRRLRGGLLRRRAARAADRAMAAVRRDRLSDHGRAARGRRPDRGRRVHRLLDEDVSHDRAAGGGPAAHRPLFDQLVAGHPARDRRVDRSCWSRWARRRSPSSSWTRRPASSNCSAGRS